MKKRMFSIGIIISLPIVAFLYIFSQGFFFTPNKNIETFNTYEKQLSKLFVAYSKQSDTMTDEEFEVWESEVDEVSLKTAKALVKIQKDPEDWKTYLSSTGQPYRPSPLAEWEYTGFAAKSSADVTSDEFYAWLAERDKQGEDRHRARLRADGIWDDEKIEQMIAELKEERANDPERQAHREKWYQLKIWKEGQAERDRKRSEDDRKEAEYQSWKKEQKAYLAAEGERIANMLSGESDTPTEQTPEPQGEFDDFESLPPLERDTEADDDDPKGIDPPQPPQLPQGKPFNPEAFAATLSEDMSRWDETLQESYQDVFNLDESFKQRLPPQARQFFTQRRERLQFEYVTRIDDVLRKTPRENRADTLRIVRERLSDNWDSDFVDAVIEQLQLDEK